MRIAVGYVAVDDGPCLALRPLASQLPGTWLPQVSNWTSELRDRGIGLLMCGTSDSAAGRQREAEARLAGNELGIPVVVIEDFPGNYAAVEGGAPRLLIVGNDFEARLARAKEPQVAFGICPCVRYDALRRRLGELRASHDGENAILWIGQPETGDSLETLRRLAPALVARDCRLWLRAHPRDAGHARGAYASLPIEDVTSRPLDECLARRPRLVVTQFSSVAIEAGFWGIPSLNVLFADVGGRRLAAKKGYAIPPWCQDGAAFLIVDPNDIDIVFDRALRERAARDAVMQSFDRYFQVKTEGVPMLIDLLYNHGLL